MDDCKCSVLWCGEDVILVVSKKSAWPRHVLLTCSGYRAVLLDIVPELLDPGFRSLASAAPITGHTFTCIYHDPPPRRSLCLVLHRPQLKTSYAPVCARRHHAQHTHGSQTTPRKLSTPVRLRSSCPRCHTFSPGVPHSGSCPALSAGYSSDTSGAVPHTVVPIPSLSAQSAVWS